jgi:hypothetical protein
VGFAPAPTASNLISLSELRFLFECEPRDPLDRIQANQTLSAASVDWYRISWAGRAPPGRALSSSGRSDGDAGLRLMRTNDLHLACACARGDAEAIAAFERHCLGVVDEVAVDDSDRARARPACAGYRSMPALAKAACACLPFM